MPLRVLAATDALENIKTSPIARWPNRNSAPNRFNTYASPAFHPSFTFLPGCTIFTIGSCFARNVEEALERHGFDVPTRRIWIDDATGKASDNWMLDNYSVPAIYNEIAWALGEEDYNLDDNTIELSAGRFADLHLPHRIPLGTLAEVLARRHRVFEVTRSLLTADVLVMTLGLVEVWKDEKTGRYLNTRPHRATILSDPDRFNLHVLSPDEVWHFLDRTFEIIFRRCSAALKILLTVSPVPMAATYTGVDVAVANQYSKAVLRTAAEMIVQTHKRIDYFPSYESVILSDRNAAWEDDQIHVQPALIARNVEAMIAAYTGSEVLQSASPAKARATDEASPILNHAADLLRSRQYAAAASHVAPLLKGPMSTQALTVQATSYLRLGQLTEAENAVREALRHRSNWARLQGLLGEIMLRQDRLAEADCALSQALDLNPGAARWCILKADVLSKLGRHDDAKQVVDEGLRANPGYPQLVRIQERLSKLPANVLHIEDGDQR